MNRLLERISLPFQTAALGAALALTPNLSQSQAAGSPYTHPSNLGPAQQQTWNVRNFGYLVAGVPKPELMAKETRNHANNFSFIYDAGNPSSSSKAIQEMSSDFKGVIFVDSIFFTDKGTFHSDSTIASNIATFKQAMGSQAAHISYLGFDEPIWRVQKTGGYGPSATTMNKVVPQLERWASMLRQQFPGVGLMYVEAHPMVRSNLILPVNFDSYGFDCYLTYDQCSRDNTGTSYSVRDLFMIMKNKVNTLNNNFGGHRRLSLILPTHMMTSPDRAVLPNQGLSGNAELVTDTRLFPASSSPDAPAKALIHRYITELASDPMVTLVGGFIWNTGVEAQATWYGARGLPGVRSYLETYGRNVTGKSGTIPLSNPLVELNSVGNHNGTAVWSWSASQASSCRSVTEQSGPYPPNGILLGSVLAAGQTYTIECTGLNGVTVRKTIPETLQPAPLPLPLLP